VFKLQALARVSTGQPCLTPPHDEDRCRFKIPKPTRFIGSMHIPVAVETERPWVTVPLTRQLFARALMKMDLLVRVLHNADGGWRSTCASSPPTRETSGTCDIRASAKATSREIRAQQQPQCLRPSARSRYSS
jgi:hypothetical protein